MNSKPSIYGLTLDALSGWLTQNGEKKSRAAHIWEALYTARVSDFDQMTAVNGACLDLLKDRFALNTMTEFVKQEASDGTVKFLLQLHDGSLIETVLMRKKYGLSVCVTTQVGCNIGCSFCASGLIKKSRDLTAGEIVEQIMTVQHYLDAAGQDEKVTNIVVMGIGEPFDNFEHLIQFLEVVKDRKGLAIAAKRITVSTSGIPSKIRAFADLGTQTHLAISLHAPNNDLRTQIMMINRAFPLEQLMDAVRYYLKTTNRRIMFEYILLSEVNDGTDTAAQLADLLDEFKDQASINLIPYNPVDEHSQYQRSTPEAINSFYDVLKKRNINATVRMEHGTDIDAACGQLRSKQIRKDGQSVRTGTVAAG